MSDSCNTQSPQKGSSGAAQAAMVAFSKVAGSDPAELLPWMLLGIGEAGDLVATYLGVRESCWELRGSFLLLCW